MKKKKILLMSDDLRMHSGIATVSKDIVLETLLSFKRAGAKLILTYHACDASQWLQDT